MRVSELTHPLRYIMKELKSGGKNVLNGTWLVYMDADLPKFIIIHFSFWRFQ